MRVIYYFLEMSMSTEISSHLNDIHYLMSFVFAVVFHIDVDVDDDGGDYEGDGDSNIDPLFKRCQ